MPMESDPQQALLSDDDLFAEPAVPQRTRLSRFDKTSIANKQELDMPDAGLGTPDPYSRATRRRYTRPQPLPEQDNFLRQLSEPSVLSPSGRPIPVSEPKSSGVALWLQAVGASLPLFVLSYSSCVSYAQLIVSGSPVSSNVVTSMHLVSSGLTGLILPLRSTCPLVVTSADISITMFYQQVVKDIVESAPAGTERDIIAATGLLALPICTILMSLVFWLVGQQRLTVAVSYLPYPVVAGFLGSIGWAIFAGAFAVLSGQPVTVPLGLPHLAQELPYQFAAAIVMAFGAILMKCLKMPARAVAVMPMCIALSGFWASVMFSGGDVSAWREELWLFPEAVQESLWHLWTEEHVSEVSWPLLFPKVSTFLGMGAVVVLSLTLRIAGIEGSTGTVMDVDDEVKWTGIASLIAGVCGTVIGSHSPGLTTFNAEAGSLDVKASIVTSLLQLLLWLSGVPAMNLFPRFLLSGILMNLGLMMLIEWLWVARHKVGWLGLAVIYSQVTASAMYGLLPSVFVGVVAACISNQYRLMTGFVLKFHVSGHSIHSWTRNSQLDLLDLTTEKTNFAASQIEAVGLEGFLAEGPIMKFSNYMRKYVAANRKVRYIIMDFRFTQGTTASACALIAKLDKFLQQDGRVVIYTNADNESMKTMASFGIDAERMLGEHQSQGLGDVGHSKLCSNFHEALQACEEAIRCNLPTRTLSLFEAESPLPEDRTIALAHYLDCDPIKITWLIEAGAKWEQLQQYQKLVSEGEKASRLGFVVPHFGQVTETVDVYQCIGPPHFLSVSKLGALAGAETLLYGEAVRTTLAATEPDGTWILWASAELVNKIKTDDPALYGRLHQLAGKAMLRRNDALVQAVELNKGGGWRGVHFDRRTAEVCASLNFINDENIEDEDSNFDGSSKQRMKTQVYENVISRPMGLRAGFSSMANSWLSNHPRQLKRRSLFSNVFASPDLAASHLLGAEASWGTSSAFPSSD